jgi:hypothetical protein
MPGHPKTCGFAQFDVLMGGVWYSDDRGVLGRHSISPSRLPVQSRVTSSLWPSSNRSTSTVELIPHECSSAEVTFPGLGHSRLTHVWSERTSERPFGRHTMARGPHA